MASRSLLSWMLKSRKATRRGAATPAPCEPAGDATTAIDCPACAVFRAVDKLVSRSGAAGQIYLGEYRRGALDTRPLSAAVAVVLVRGLLYFVPMTAFFGPTVRFPSAADDGGPGLAAWRGNSTDRSRKMHAYFSRRAGMPTYVPGSSMFSVTTAPAPTMTSAAILMPGSTTAPVPRYVQSPTSTSPASTAPGPT